MNNYAHPVLEVGAGFEPWLPSAVPAAAHPYVLLRPYRADCPDRRGGLSLLSAIGLGKEISCTVVHDATAGATDEIRTRAIMDGNHAL